MDASVALHPAENPRNRSLEARRAARRVRFERERLIVDSLNRGLSVHGDGCFNSRFRQAARTSIPQRVAAAASSASHVASGWDLRMASSRYAAS